LDGAVRQKIEKSLPDCHALALGEGDLFPESHVPTLRQVTNSLSAPSLALGEGPLPRVLEHVTRGTVFYFLVFLPHFFCDAFPRYLKLLAQICLTFEFFLLYFISFFLFLEFLDTLQI
jgi:hypothetical protein